MLPICKSAPAKINLTLHVTGQREDGFHLLDSVVTFTEFSDRLTFEPADKLTLEINGPFAKELEPDNDNLILKAARAIRKYQSKPEFGARITLQKNLPIASGIGGGSADAAAALLGLIELWRCEIEPETLKEIALTLGADVPMCLEGIPARMQGIGEGILPLPLPSFPIVLVNPNKSVSTPTIFKQLKTKDNPPLAPLPEDRDWLSYLTKQRNDLEPPATELEPRISNCLQALRQSGTCKLARMSGSGATIFGLFDTDKDAQSAAQSISNSHPNWWVVATSTIIGQAENADNLRLKT